MTTQNSDIEIMAAFESRRQQGCGEAIGLATDTPAEAIERANETGEVIGMTSVRAIYAGTHTPGRTQLATDTAGRVWVVADINGPWAIDITGGV